MTGTRVAVVTGAGSGFGRAAALALAAGGYSIAAIDVRLEPAQETAGLVVAAGGSAVAHAVDVSDAAAVRRVFADVQAGWGRVDAAVNNAGILVGGRILDEGADSDYERTVAVNQTGVWNCCRSAILAMRESGGGAIVNTASGAAILPTPGSPAYGLTKAAVVHLTRSLAAAHGRDGIRVNAILPGPTATGIFGSAMSQADLERHYLPTVPLGRMGTVDDVARAIAWLCSDAASFITGAVLPVDGGYHLTPRPGLGAD